MSKIHDRKGLSETRISGIYCKMVRRCNNPKDVGYKKKGYAN